MSILVRRIKKVIPHPQADRLNVNYVDIDGGEVICVSNKTQDDEQRYYEGDLVVYIPEGYILSENLLKKLDMWNEEEDKGVLAGPYGNVVKNIKLRGVLSQGVLFPVSSEFFEHPEDIDVGVNVQEKFNIKDPIIVEENSIQTNKGGVFEKYASIENSYQADIMGKFDEVISHKSIKWVIMEKIHGANFQVYFDEHGIKCGKRTAFLGDEENFYCYQHLITKDMIKKLEEIYNSEKQPIRIFGELFGGKYEAEHNYKDEVRISNPKCVQREIQYSPFNQILFYDVEIGGRILSWKEVEQFIERYNLNKDCGLQFEKPIKIVEETLSDVIKENNKFESVISQVDLNYLNLPVIKDNICEGIIIKPYNQEYRCFDGSRIIIKSKNEKFAERRHEKKPVDTALYSSVQDTFNLVKDYINENRANAVISKDSWGKHDFGKFLSNFVSDIYESIEKDGIKLPQDEKAQAMLKQKISKECLKYREAFLRVIS